MAATAFQQRLCRLIATSRRGSGESYVAGGVALNTLLQAPRISRDIDLFHDTDEALRVSWENDRTLLIQDWSCSVRLVIPANASHKLAKSIRSLGHFTDSSVVCPPSTTPKAGNSESNPRPSVVLRVQSARCPG